MHGSKLIQALESAWSDIRTAYPDVPDAVIITGTAHQGRRIVRGHFAAARWTTAELNRETGEVGLSMPEVFLAGELFQPQDGPDSDAERPGGFGGRVMQTLVHEAAHGRAHTAGRKDTSRGGRYHNRIFLFLAEEMGLSKPQAPDPTLGWSDCHLDQLGRWGGTVERLNAAHVPHRKAPALSLAPGMAMMRSGQRTSCECACDPPRKLAITPKQMEAGLILCGVCREPFEG